MQVLNKHRCMYTVEPPNNGHGGDEHFVHSSEVVPSSEVLPLSTIINYFTAKPHE